VDLLMTSTNDNELIHVWKNITLVEEESDLANKLLPCFHS